MNYNQLIEWLLEGDISIVYRTKKELLNEDNKSLKKLEKRLTHDDGYIKQYLEYRDSKTGLWANGIYLPKYTSTHYTMLELKNLNCPKDLPEYYESALILLDTKWLRGKNGKRNPDLCVMAMIGSIVSYARIIDSKLYDIVDYILEHVQTDGGFNCSWERSDVSSVHTTLTTLRFFLDYELNDYSYRLKEIKVIALNAERFLLDRNLYQKKNSSITIHKNFINMPYPNRWKFDFLKALEYFVDRGRPYDEGMNPALNLLVDKRLKSGAWSNTRGYGGKEYFKIKDEGRDSRINTLRALKVLKFYRPEAIDKIKN